MIDEREEAGFVPGCFQGQVDDALPALLELRHIEFFAPMDHAVGIADVVPELEVPEGVAHAHASEWRHHAAYGFAIHLEINEHTVVFISGYRCLNFGRHRLGNHVVNGANIFGERHGKMCSIAELRLTEALPNMTGRDLKRRTFRHFRTHQQIVAEADLRLRQVADHRCVVDPLVTHVVRHHKVHDAIGKDRLSRESGRGVQVQRRGHGVKLVDDGHREMIASHGLRAPRVRRLDGMGVDHGEIGHHAGIQAAFLKHDGGRVESVVADHLVHRRAGTVLFCRGAVHEIRGTRRQELPGRKEIVEQRLAQRGGNIHMQACAVVV